MSNEEEQQELNRLFSLEKIQLINLITNSNSHNQLVANLRLATELLEDK